MCSLFGVRRGPRCPRSSPPAASSARSRASALPGLAGVPITGVLGDQQAALFGQALRRARHGQGDLRHRGVRALPTPAAPCPRRRRRAASRPSRGTSATRRRPTRSRARRSSPAPRSSGCATSSASSRAAPSSSRCAERRSQRRRRVRARVHRAGLAVLARRRARRDHSGSAAASGRAQVARALVEALAFQVRAMTDAFAAARRRARPSCAPTAARRRWTCSCGLQATGVARAAWCARRRSRRPRAARR